MWRQRVKTNFKGFLVGDNIYYGLRGDDREWFEVAARELRLKMVRDIRSRRGARFRVGSRGSGFNTRLNGKNTKVTLQMIDRLGMIPRFIICLEPY